MAAQPSQTFTTLGMALSIWSQVEMEVTGLFVHISGMEWRKAVALFDTIVDFRLRLQLVDRMMAFQNVEPVEAEMWARMSARLLKTYKKRHEMAHFTIVSTNGEIGISPFLTYEKILEAQGGPPKTLTEKQLRERVARFTAAIAAVSWFKNRAAYRRQESYVGPQPPLEEPPFVSQLRQLAIQTLEERKLQPKSPPPADDW